jgi:hypothetical protein
LDGNAKEGSLNEIEGKDYDIRGDCRRPLAEKLKGKGRKILETIPAAVGTRTRTVSAVARTAAEIFGEADRPNQAASGMDPSP